VQYLVIFIPRNRYDASSAAIFIEQYRTEIDANVLMGDVGQHPEVDRMRFNLQEQDSDDICHPSPYRYQTIAEYIAGLMRANNVWLAK
jgi:hypothetical protein